MTNECDIDSLLSRIDVAEDEIERIKQAKDFIKSHISDPKIPKNRVDLALRKLSKHLKLSPSGFKNLKDYYKEEVASTESDENEREIDYDEEGISEETQKEAKAEAQRIMKEGDPLEFILNTIKIRHIGDETLEEALAVSIAGQSCYNTNGIQIGANGLPGSGKSHAFIMHLHLIRMRHKIEATISAKALYYAEIKPGTIVFSDDTEPDEAMEQTIKRATTNYQGYTTHLTVKDQSSLNLVIPPRINWYLTSVESTSSAQLLSRQFKCNTLETKEQKDAITSKQKQEAESGNLGIAYIDFDVLVCRYIYDEMKSKMFNVKIPYAEKIIIHDNRDSRNTSMFLDMIMGYAIFYHMQRETDEEGYLLADESDFWRAKKLFDSQLESSVTKLTDRERLVLRYIADHRIYSTISQIALGTGIPQSSVRSILRGRKDSASEGLLGKIKGLTVSRETHSSGDEGSHISKTQDYFEYFGSDDLKELHETGFATLGGDTP